MRCFTVLGPSQSGKTTLVKALGELEGGSQETAFSDRLTLRTFDYIGETWAALDVAGGADNLGAAGHALAASDSVVLCVAPDPDSAAQAAPYLRFIEEADVPCYLFINRMDAAEARVRDTVAALQTYASRPVVLRQIPMREGGQIVGSVDLISERAWEYQEGKPSNLIELPDAMRDAETEARTELLENLADFDDDLLEQLIEDKVPAPENVFALVSQMHQRNAFIAAYMGAAEHGNGLFRLMKSLRHESSGPGDIPERLGIGAATAVAVYADNRKHVGKSVLLRDLNGGLAQGGTIGGDTIGALNGVDGKPITAALEPGGLAIAVKSDHLNPGNGYTEAEAMGLPEWTRGLPAGFLRVLTPDNDRDDARLSGALAKMEAIDPGLTISHDEETGHLVAHLQGPMHMRRLTEKLSEDFDIPVSDHSVAGSYCETITRNVEKRYRHRKQSGGAGQFADIVFTLAPNKRGEGFSFDEVVKGGSVPRNYIPSVEAGAKECLAKGPLGFRVVDVGVTLMDGKHHSVDSSDYAFKTAALIGIREALREARPVLLQPIEHVDIHVPSIYSGQLVAQVSSLKGQVLGFDPHPVAKGWDIFRALLPASVRDELFQALSGMTQGTAWVESRFDHYEELHGREAEKIQAERAEAMA
ncbi:Translation elongation factor G-related protein [Candidatus Rhodobacter oscarellae]|uniref:Elongation factor G n=1 Tax=Candidatus Rhodobacter oscarellae TaxID=1675527 RepID=A0A0J9EBD9_9RHOB|nr:elongation factor G [Candidatus Rhodobacter lobularis]KMW59009.1 Translation elongation factor G-related protein [Candidatus Rhodobacter lobularis]